MSDLISHSFSDPGATRALSHQAAPRLSIVIPLYNESDSLGALHARLKATVETMALNGHELLFVDDGSRDDTYGQVAALAATDSALRAIRFARNFGKEAAMAAGLRAASGDIVVLMDGDLQHPPEQIPAMLERWRRGAKMVTMVRRSRDTDPWLRRTLSRGFYRLFKRVSEVALAEGGGDFRLFDRAVVDAINSLPERTRFMKGITSWVGFQQETLDFEPAERTAGASAWSLLRLLRYALDGLSAFSTLPLRIWSMIGVFMAMCSGLYGMWLIVRTVIWGIDIPGYASVMVSGLFLSGVQLIGLGVLGEYIGRIFTEVKQRPLYLVAERIGFDEADR